MASFFTLQAQVGFLKGIDPLSADATENGLTAADLTKAETMAHAEIVGYLGQCYATSGWTDPNIPQQVQDIAEMLGSAYVISMSQGGDGLDPLTANGDGLYQRAIQRLVAIRQGDEILVDAAGDIISRVFKDGVIGSLS